MFRCGESFFREVIRLSRYRLEEDIKLCALAYVKGYPRRKSEYMAEYNAILNESSFPYEEYEIDGIDENGKPCKIKSLAPKARVTGMVGNPTEQKAFRLEMLQRSQDTKLMNAVERAMDLIGDRIRSDDLRKRLVQAVLLNCLDRYENTYESFGLNGICRTDFYAERRRFLWYVAKYSGLLKEE